MPSNQSGGVLVFWGSGSREKSWLIREHTRSTTPLVRQLYCSGNSLGQFIDVNLGFGFGNSRGCKTKFKQSTYETRHSKSKIRWRHPHTLCWTHEALVWLLVMDHPENKKCQFGQFCHQEEMHMQESFRAPAGNTMCSHCYGLGTACGGLSEHWEQLGRPCFHFERLAAIADKLKIQTEYA